MLDLLLLIFIGTPIFGSKFLLFLFAFVRQFLDYVNNNATQSFNLYVLLALLPIIVLGTLKGELVTATSIAVSYFVGHSLAKSTQFTPTHLRQTVFVVVFLHLLSFLSLELIGYDFLPNLIFGESRHLVPLNSPFPYRPSAFLREPSNLCVLYFALIILSNTKKQYNTSLVCALMSLLTFSGISILSIGLLSFQRMKLNHVFIIVPVLGVLLFGVIGPFLLAKISAYAVDYSSYSRIADFLQWESVEVLFGKDTLTSTGVLLDNGPILFLFYKYGLFSLPLIAFLSKKAVSRPALFFMFCTKISLTLPLIWFLIFHDNNSFRRT